MSRLSTALVACTILIASAAQAASDPGYATMPRITADVNNDGVPDYCRFVGSQASPQFSCRLMAANGTVINEYGYNSSGAIDPGYLDMPYDLIDVTGDGRKDFCRFVGTRAAPTIACVPNTGTGWGANYAFKTPTGIDPGYPNFRVFQDVNSDGRMDFCRLVGNSKQEFMSCILATPTGFSSDQYGSVIPCGCWTRDSFVSYFSVKPTCDTAAPSLQGSKGTALLGPTVPGPCQYDSSKTCYSYKAQGWNDYDATAGYQCITRTGNGDLIGAASKNNMTRAQYLACEAYVRDYCGYPL